MPRSPEQFNPTDPQYKKTEDLPKEQQDEFIDTEKGFVKKEANKIYDDCKKLGWPDEAIFKQLREKAIWQEKYGEYLQREALEIIQKNEQNGLQEVARRLDLGGGEVLYTAESLFKKLYENGGGEYSDLINKMTDIMNSLEKRNFTNWSHSVCHLFEDYGGRYGMPGFRSLFDSPDNLRASEKLIGEGVKRSMENNQMGCMDRMLGKLPQYNLDNLDITSFENKFVFKPDPISQSEFVKIMEKSENYLDYLKVFLMSDNPKNFIATLVRKKIKIPLSDYKQKNVVDFLKLVEGEIDKKDIDAYVDQCYKVNEQKTTFDELAKNISEAKEAEDIIEGTYIDVEGTLIRNNKLNKDLVWQLKEYYSDKQVVVFTGGSPEEATKRLRSLGFPEELLPVKPKTDFKGKVLKEVIDDTQPEFQGFKAINYRRS